MLKPGMKCCLVTDTEVEPGSPEAGTDFLFDDFCGISTETLQEAFTTLHCKGTEEVPTDQVKQR